MSLPGSESLLKTDFLRELELAGRRGMKAEDLGGDRGSSARAQGALAGLQAEGLAVERSGRWYAVAATLWLAGRVEWVDREGARVRALTGRSVFRVRKRDTRGAMQGDTVLLRPLSQEKGRSRRDEGDPFASVVRVLARRWPTMLGAIQTEGERRLLVPFDSRLNLELEVVGEPDVEDGCYVVVQVQEPASRGSSPPRGEIVEILGQLDEPGVDVRVILLHYGIPDQYPPAVLAAANDLPTVPADRDFKGRNDLRDQLTVTIDGADARDFDDAISVSALPGGGFRLGVHIADVAHYVRDGSALDLEAYRRGTSVYYPDRAIPMLPERLSNGLCSLRPDEDRLTLTVVLDISESGEVLRTAFSETAIRSSRRLTYSEVHRLIEAPLPGDPQEYGKVLEMLQVGEKLMQSLLRARARRGSLDMDLPAGQLELDEQGRTVGVHPAERTCAHRMIEEFMIAANEAVARKLAESETAAVFRIHEAPLDDEIEDLVSTLSALGLDFDPAGAGSRSSQLQHVLDLVRGRPEEPFVGSLVLRSMKQALYTPHSKGHFALGSEHYCHFTSPIRRYPDLLVHRRLKALLHGRAGSEAKNTRLVRRLPAIADQCCQTERRAERSERELKQWKLVRWMSDRVGDKFTGRITGVQPFGLFVQIDDCYVDGLVPIRTLADDYYEYDAKSHRLVGASGKRVFRLADPVEIVIVAASAGPRGLELRIEGMPEPSRRRRGRRRGDANGGSGRPRRSRGTARLRS